MIVCSCNLLSDATIRGALARASCPTTRVVDVYHGLGCRAKCGRCATTIRGLMAQAGVAVAGAECELEGVGSSAKAA